MLEVLQAARNTGKAAGKHCLSGREVGLRIDQGFQFLALSSDAGILAEAARREFEAIEVALGSGEEGGQSGRSLY